MIFVVKANFESLQMIELGQEVQCRGVLQFSGLSLVMNCWMMYKVRIICFMGRGVMESGKQSGGGGDITLSKLRVLTCNRKFDDRNRELRSRD